MSSSNSYHRSRQNNVISTTTSRSLFWLLIISCFSTLLLLLLINIVVVDSVPIQSTINQHTSECFFEELTKGEHITVSVFILAGSELKAPITIDGPIPSANDSPTIDTGLALHQAIERYDRGHKTVEGLRISEYADFEHLNIESELTDDIPPDDEEDINSGSSDEGGSNHHNEHDSTTHRHQIEELKRRRQLEIKERKESRKRKQKSKIRSEGDPWQISAKAPNSGWYRVCVSAPFYQIIAEIDIRKESDYGGIDDNTGHVLSMVQRTLRDEEELLLSDTAADEGITDEDFVGTREKLKTLRRLLAEIQSKQSQERHRLIVHAATNEHSHSRMVLSSLIETILFMLVTGFQVFTIRRWFKTAPVLGR